MLQTVIAAVDHGLGLQQAIEAPRIHWEDGVLYTEPGADVDGLPSGGSIAEFRAANLFFGGVQAVARAHDGTFDGGGDPRRGGAVAWA